MTNNPDDELIPDQMPIGEIAGKSNPNQKLRIEISQLEKLIKVSKAPTLRMTLEMLLKEKQQELNLREKYENHA